jgi:hypothetical protein
VPAETPNKPQSADGIPDEEVDAEPKGTPTSDRHFSETSAHEKGGSAEAEKHSYEKA